MTAPEVDWVLGQFGSVVGSITAPLKRVDRDNSEILEGSIRTRTGELQDANFVGATYVDREATPIGTEYDHQVEAIVGVRIEGLHHSEFGHVDPTGFKGIPWTNASKTGLVDRLRDSLLASRTFPDAGDTDTTYTDLRITNEADQSDNYADYYRRDFDIIFGGYEDLP